MGTSRFHEILITKFLLQVECKNYLGDLDVNLTAFIVDRDTPGLHISKPYSLTALNGLEVCDVTFDCNLATNTLLGRLYWPFYMLDIILIFDFWFYQIFETATD